MVVRAETPFRTLQDFVAFARANPGKLNFAYGNMGSLAGGADAQCLCGNQDHGRLLSRHAAGNDRLACRPDRFRRDGRVADPGARQGRQAARARDDGHPPRRGVSRHTDHGRGRLPSTSACCCPGRACIGPPGCRLEIVTTLNQAVREAVNTPEGKRFFAVYGSETGAMTAAEFADFVKQELKRWEGIVAMTGLPKQ